MKLGKLGCFYIFGVAALAGCAQPSRQIASTYVPTAAYAGYSCRQVSDEMQRIVRRLADYSGVQDEHARGDAIKTGAVLAGAGALATGGAGLLGTNATATSWYGSASVNGSGVGTVIAGSALGAGLLVHGDDANTNQLAMLKGELDAAERAFIQKNCNDPIAFNGSHPASQPVVVTYDRGARRPAR